MLEHQKSLPNRPTQTTDMNTPVSTSTKPKPPGFSKKTSEPNHSDPKIAWKNWALIFNWASIGRSHNHGTSGVIHPRYLKKMHWKTSAEYAKPFYEINKGTLERIPQQQIKNKSLLQPWILKRDSPKLLPHACRPLSATSDPLSTKRMKKTISLWNLPVVVANDVRVLVLHVLQVILMIA